MNALYLMYIVYTLGFLLFTLCAFITLGYMYSCSIILQYWLQTNAGNSCYSKLTIYFYSLILLFLPPPILVSAAVIGFVDSNTSLTLIEGGTPQTVCFYVRPEGLELDLFDSVYINIRTEMGKIYMLSNYIVQSTNLSIWLFATYGV